MEYFYYYYCCYNMLTCLTVLRILCLIIAIVLFCNKRTDYKILGALFLIMYLLLLILHLMIKFKANI